MKLLKTFCLILLVAAVLGFSSGASWAIPSASFLYEETDLGGGLWQYEYTLFNTSDPIADPAFDLYYVNLTFSPTVTIMNISSPTDWDFISNESPPASGSYADFIDWFSTIPGPPPVGSDISPGSSLIGFSFISDTQLASLPFETILLSPEDADNPVSSSGNTTPVPEPMTLLLLGSGLAGIGFFGKTRFSHS